jgi:hypothetical protein
MRKKIDYNINQTMVVTNETIKGIGFDLGTVTSTGVLAPLADLNEISIDLSVKRHGEKEQDIFRGYLDDLLTGLYAQTPSYELQKRPFGLTHKIKIDFLGGVLELKEGDVLNVSVKVPTSTFTGLDASKPQSYVNVETIPAVGFGTPIPAVEAIGIGSGEINLDRQIGSNVVKVVAALDFTAPYETSAKAKFESIEISGEGYERSISRENLELENIHYFDNNPESDVNQMVAFWESDPIHNVRFKGKLTKAADAKARLLVVKRIFP